MKNITLSVDERVLNAVRLYAAERNTSVNGLVRDFLTSLAQREDRARAARERMRELSDTSRARMDSKAWKRDDLHER